MKKSFSILWLCMLLVAQVSFAQTTKTTTTKSTTKTEQPAKASKPSATPVKKDGTPDKRYKANKNLKKDGTPDKRFKENKISS